MFYWLQKKILTMVGDIILSPYPFFIQYKPSQHKFKGDEYAEFIKMIYNDKIKPGDILLRCFDGYLDSKLIPGDLNHGGIYIGKNDQGVPMVIHATAEGVHKETLYDFIRTDHFAVVRPRGINQDDMKLVVDNAYSYLGCPYDFDFTYGKDSKIYCTELVGRCYEDLKDKFKFKIQYQGFGKFRRKALVADNIFVSDVDIIFMTQSIKTMSIWEERMKIDKK